MSNETQLISARLPVDLVSELEDHKEVYNISRTGALEETARRGLKTENHGVFQIELSRETTKRAKTLADDRDREVEDILEELVSRGLRTEDHDVFVAEFPQDQTEDILKFADRKRLDRDVAIQHLVREGLAVERGDYVPDTSSPVTKSAALVAFALVLFAFSAMLSPTNTPYFTREIQRLFGLASLLLIASGVGLFLILALKPLFGSPRQRVRDLWDRIKG